MKEKVKDVFNVLRELDIKATPNNVSILDGVYATLREIYQRMEETENAGTESK